MAKPVISTLIERLEQANIMLDEAAKILMEEGFPNKGSRIDRFVLETKTLLKQINTATQPKAQ